MKKLPSGWDIYDPNSHDSSNDPEYKSARFLAQQRAERRRASYGVALAHLRQAHALTQAQLARSLGVAQGEVSRIEHQTDMLTSTLSSYIEAMGGELIIVAKFPGTDPVELEIGEIFGMVFETT